MATAPIRDEPPRQLCLDVERPVLTRPRRARYVPVDAPTQPPADRQMELRMAPAARPVVPIPKEVSRFQTQPIAAPSIPSRPPFGAWLLDQAKRTGLIGELAKAVKLDRLFPKFGSVEEVRVRFASVGADGDAFMALDDAEFEYDRLS
jgi:hypothetical protein